MKATLAIMAAALLITSAGMVSPAQSAGQKQSQPHWKLQHGPGGAVLMDVSCASTSECFAVGEHATILKTVSGGKTWKRVQTGYGTANPSAVFTSVRCPVSGVCSLIATPNIVLRTTNGGRTWRKHVFTLSPLLSTLGRLACPTRPVCYVTASPSGNPSTWFTHSAAIFKTSDGGSSWHQLTIPSRTPCPGDCGSPTIGYDLQWISCQSAQSCRAGGDTFIGSHEGYASAVIRTGNGGSTWTLADHSFDPNIGTCPTPSICAGVFYQPLSPNVGPYLMRSANGGATWSSKPITPVLTSIACTGTNFCELVGPHGTLAMAIATNLFKQVSPTTQDLYGVACPRMAACYAVGANGTILARKR